MLKKGLLFLFAMSLLCVSCSKDDDKAPSLSGTKWETIENKVKSTLTFTSTDAKLVLTSTVIGSVSTTSHYTYTYKHPLVILKPDNSSNATLEGTVNSSSSTMKLVNTSTNKTIGTLEKKY